MWVLIHVGWEVIVQNVFFRCHPHQQNQYTTDSKTVKALTTFPLLLQFAYIQHKKAKDYMPQENGSMHWARLKTYMRFH